MYAQRLLVNVSVCVCVLYVYVDAILKIATKWKVQEKPHFD